jgi:adenosine deaminase
VQLDAIEAVQDYLMTEYSKDEYDIYLEACPSSNLYIGRFESVHEHPLYRWAPPPSVIPQDKFGLREGSVKVCIGSDDPGIFPTTIENEHRILEDAAIRFHSANDGVARDWIDRIRMAGMAQFERHA